MNKPGEERRLVLIVDDDPIFTLLASETLQLAGFTVRVAANRLDARATFDSERPDLVLLDVELPDASGFDLCAQLRSVPGGGDLPIIMVTGNDDTESIARAYEAGATDFINKPVLWQTLPHRVGFVLRAHHNLRALKASENKYRALLEAFPDSMYVVDGAGVILDYVTGTENARNAGHAGRRLEEILPAEIVEAALRRSDTNVGRSELTTHEFEVSGGSERRSYEARMRPQADGTFLLVVRDATERRNAEARIEYLAYYDPLTGLPNRQMFVRDVSRALAAAHKAGRGMALLYLDLDRFKRINDNLGHSVGDSLLKGVARRLEQSVRGSDAGDLGCVARLGGDEFVIVLTGINDKSQVSAVANRLERALGQPFDCDGHRFVVTPSIGIALYPQDAMDIEDLLVKADMAMYQAKDLGRNGHAFYGESMTVRSLGRLELENDLRRAFEADDFDLFYQPKLDLASGSIIGVEALLRWNHAERGAIPPDKFIPVAEETGLIVALGDWVIQRACKQLQLWAKSGLGHLNVAVNVSVQQFARYDFVDSVLRTLWQYGIKPQQIELEITESLLMRNVEGTTAALRRLGAAGLTLSIDDFGTGYSSLGYLRQFPVDALKIDRSFVQDLQVGSDAAAICSAIIAMARELKLKVIAEGVETTEQLEFLRRHQCDQVQGYLISKPVSAGDLERLLRSEDHVALPAYARAARRE